MLDQPEQLLRQAALALQAGRSDEAIEIYRRLLAVRPDLPDAWYNLGYLLRGRGDFEEALASYEQALAQGVSRPEEVRVNRAAILSEELQRGEQAEAELKAALALNPRFPLAWLNLGLLYEDWGSPAQARVAYERVLELIPDNGRALARIAAIDVFEGRAEAALPRLRAALVGSPLHPEDKSEILFALGGTLDALGEYREAFQAFADANRASRDSAAPPGIRYDRQAQERLIDSLIETFPLPDAGAPAPPNREPPLFICGMFRSGSTLAEQILGRHSRVAPGGELNLLPTLVHRHLMPYPESVASGAADLLQRVADDYLAGVRSLFPEADLVTDKRPDNFLHIGLIKALFPDARVVHTVRNPLDNLLSVYFLHFQHSVEYGLALEDAAHWYVQYRKLMEHWKGLYPADIHDFDYDQAVREPRSAVGALLDFCGLEWEEACLASHSSEHAVRTASAWQVRQPLHQRSSGRWRNYAAEIEPARRLLEAAGMPLD